MVCTRMDPAEKMKLNMTNARSLLNDKYMSKLDMGLLFIPISHPSRTLMKSTYRMVWKLGLVFHSAAVGNATRSHSSSFRENNTRLN